MQSLSALEFWSLRPLSLYRQIHPNVVVSMSLENQVALSKFQLLSRSIFLFNDY